MPGQPFIEPKDIQAFARDRVPFGRLIQEELTKGGRSSPEPLEDLVGGVVDEYVNRAGRGFRCFGISVGRSDGMSWSAHAVDTKISELAPSVRRLRLRGNYGSAAHPELEQLIPIEKIVSLAQKNGLTSVRVAGRRRRYILAVTGAIAIGAAGSVLPAAMTSQGFSAATLTLRFLVIAVLVTACAVLSQILLDKRRADSETAPIEKAAADIAAAARSEGASDGFSHFIADLAAELSRPVRFRCLIVDDFTRLDTITRQTLQVYLQDYVDPQCPELWVLFYSTDDKWLAEKAGSRGSDKPYGFLRVKLYRLAHLSASQRQRLAKDRGVPERADFYTVGAIVTDGTSATVMTELFQREYDDRAVMVEGEGVRTGDILRFFYVLALNAVPGHNPWMYTAEVRKNLARQTRYRSRIMALLMGGQHLSSTQIAQYLRIVTDKYFPQAGSGAGENLGGLRSRRFLIAPDADVCLESAWREFGLPDPAIAHLFWALYWSDTELHGAANIAVLPKVCMHLLRSTTPASLREQLGGSQADLDALTNEVLNTVIEIIRTCLKLCRPGDIPQLFQYALRLAEDDRQEVERHRRDRLRPLAWQAYGLLGQEKLLLVILELEQAPPRKPADGGPRNDLTFLHLQSIAGADSETRGLIFAELTKPRTARHSGAFARARAGWLIAAAAPFLRSGMPSLNAAARDARERLPELVEASITSLQAVSDGEWRTTDFLEVVTGLWAMALIGDASRAPQAGWKPTPRFAARCVDVLTHAWVLATDFAKERDAADPSPATIDLVLDCLAQELLAVVLAAGTVMLVRWPQAAWRPAQVRDEPQAAREDIVEVVRESARLLGVRDQALTPPGGTPGQPLFDELARHMALLAVLWRRLGFSQQASFMAIRQAQVLAVLRDRDAHLAESVIELLASEIQQPDHVGLMAHLATAESAGASLQLAAEWLARCAKAAIREQFGDRLAADLCIAAVNAGHAFNVDLAECLSFLLDNWSDTSTPRLETLLADVRDDEISSMTRALLNVVTADTTDRADQVQDQLERKIGDIADPVARETVTGMFRIFALRRHLAAKQPVDVSVELAAWEDLKTAPDYATLLGVLLPVASHEHHDYLVSEAVRVLDNFAPYITTTGYVILTRQLLATSGISSDVRAVGLRALERGFDYMEHVLSADTNIAILTVLKQLDRQHADKYRPKFFDWLKIMLELDETRRLPEAADQGRYFLLLWHYFQLFADYGLQSEPRIGQYGLDDDEKARALRDWQANGCVVPDPVIGAGAAARLSGDFLRWGYALFYPPPSKQQGKPVTEAQAEQARQHFDHKAMTSIGAVYHLLRRLPGVPQAVQLILRRHEQITAALLNDRQRDPADA